VEQGRAFKNRLAFGPLLPQGALKDPNAEADHRLFLT
jgi:hypothetical protein